MIDNYKESFEQIKIAGELAADTLDEVTTYVKPGITTEKLDKIGIELLNEIYNDKIFSYLDINRFVYYSRGTDQPIFELN